jgi:hypothetical protein
VTAVRGEHVDSRPDQGAGKIDPGLVCVLHAAGAKSPPTSEKIRDEAFIHPNGGDQMRARRSGHFSKVATILVIAWACAGLARAQTWQKVNNAPNASTCLLLTDGTVMCNNGEESEKWRLLTPDNLGRYESGQWTNLADMPQVDNNNNPQTYKPLYFASVVLADGRVVVVGGEYNDGLNMGNPVWTNIGFMYNPPPADSWSAQLTVPGGWTVGDAQSVVLPNGTMVMADINSGRVASFDPSTLTFTPVNGTGGTGKLSNNDEEGWSLLPDGTILTVDANAVPKLNQGTAFEIYTPGTFKWTSPGFTPILLSDVNPNSVARSTEVGPAVLRPDGTLVYFSGHILGGIAIYDINTGNWTTAVNFPVDNNNLQLTCSDAPAAILRNGNVLVETSPGVILDNSMPPKFIFQGGVHFFEFDTINSSTGNVTDVTSGGPPTGGPSFHGRMLVLPTGQVLFTDGSNTVWTYTPNNDTFPDAWRPAITAGPHVVDPGHTYTISGKQFNGLSQGASYGDDAQSATNYPLVRYTNDATGHVFYGKTHDHSSMAVQALGSSDIVSTQFDTPAGMETGRGKIEVVVNGIPSLALIVNGPVLTLPGPISLTTCAGTPVTGTANVCNTGREDLTINSFTSPNPLVSITTPSSGFPVNISPDFCFPFQVKFSPVAGGSVSTLLSITTNDPNTPSATLEFTGTSLVPSINATLANSGQFGDVCAGDQAHLALEVTNQGECNLVISNILLSNGNFLPPSVTLPLTLSADATVSLPITFKPSAAQACNDTTPRSGTVSIASNDPANPVIVKNVSGVVPCPNVRVTGSGAFGEVCGGANAEKSINVCDVGKCTMTVTGATLSAGCGDFTLVNNPFPAPVSHDFCLGLTVRYTPTSCGAHACTLTVMTDDPDTPVIPVDLSADTPCPSIDVPPDLGFPPTVISSVGACVTPEPFPVSNTGNCPLKITGFSIATDAAEYSLSGLPSFPIILLPGHEAGEGDLDVDFAPDNLGRALLGSVKVTYVSDPITGATTDVTRALCGEGVRTGARVLVTAGGVPMASVEQIKLTRINANRNKNLLDTVDNARNLTLQTVTPPGPCGPFQYHREYSTVSNPIQLLPGSYQVTVTAIVNHKRMKKTVGFDVNTCGFNPTIVVNF